MLSHIKLGWFLVSKHLTSQSVMMLTCLQHTNLDILPVRCYISYTENLPLQSTLQFTAIVANSFHAIIVIYLCALAMITSSGWTHTYATKSCLPCVYPYHTCDVCTPLFSSLAEQICMSHLTIGNAVFYTSKLSQFFVVHAWPAMLPFPWVATVKP